MTKEYISRDEMIEQTKARIILGMPKFNIGLETAIEVATSIPAADVVEVVRCKDCKNRFNHYICAYRGDNWFCGYGERRADNG